MSLYLLLHLKLLEKQPKKKYINQSADIIVKYVCDTIAEKVITRFAISAILLCIKPNWNGVANMNNSIITLETNSEFESKSEEDNL